MNDRVTNVRLVGVGGQGILIASEVLCEALLVSGYDVKKSEIHGMAQRGGSVNSDIRFGQKVFSPIIPEGAIDLLVAFEQMETLRHIDDLRQGGTVIINEQRILPSAVASGKLAYPSDVEEQVRQRAGRVHLVNGLSIARRAGSLRSVNLCLLGTASGLLEVEESVWTETISRRFKNKGLAANLKAFGEGRNVLISSANESIS